MEGSDKLTMTNKTIALKDLFTFVPLLYKIARQNQFRGSESQENIGLLLELILMGKRNTRNHSDVK